MVGLWVGGAGGRQGRWWGGEAGEAGGRGEEEEGRKKLSIMLSMSSPQRHVPK